MNRRVFIKKTTLAASLPFLPIIYKSGFGFPNDEDQKIFELKITFAKANHLHARPINEVVIEMGKSFIGTDYVADTLEQPGEEHLIIDLQGLDCVTFCENSLALARCIKMNKTTFNDFKNTLQYMRYRGGVINGYPSRLHYFSDYIYDGEKKSVFKNVTEQIGGEPYIKTINFMSSHADLYPKLKGRPEFISELKKQEEAINQRKMYHIPKDKIDSVGKKIHSGDILAITTAIKGIDVSHTGIAIWQDSKLHFMHAPDVGYKVHITEKPLSEYLASHEKQMGIMVARPVEVDG